MHSLRHFLFALLIAVVVFNGISCSKGAKVRSLAVTPYSGTMVNGQTSMANSTTRQLVATATLTDGSQFNFTQVVAWSSSDESVATVDNIVTKGSVSAVTMLNTNQTTTITAIDTVNHVSASIGINVASPLSLAITPANPHMHFGAIHQFSAMVNFPDTTTQDVTSYSSWTVSPPEDANVTNPVLGVIGGGFVSIPTLTTIITTASLEATFASLPIATTPLSITSVPVSSPLVVNPVSPIISAGTATQFTATGYYLISGATTTFDFTSSVTWFSSNTAVATINSAGLATTGTTTGTTIIYATDPITDYSGNTTLTVQ